MLIKPRMFGQTDAILRVYAERLKEGQSIGFYMKKEASELERYQNRFRELGVDTNAEEMSASRLECIYDNDPFEPAIIGWKTITKFTGYKLTKK